MKKASILLVPLLLLFTWDICEGLECYNCYQGVNATAIDSNMVQCNEANMSASNVWLCPSPNARCTYSTMELVYNKAIQTWRTCSNGISDPCDPNSAPPGTKMLECHHCGTDRCNLEKPRKEEEKDNEFTFNINANINLYIRQ